MLTFHYNIEENKLESGDVADCSIIPRMFPIMLAPDSQNLVLTADCKTLEIVEYDRAYETRTVREVCY